MARQKTPFVSLKPKGMYDAVWREIIDAWENGLSDREAAFRASKNTGKYISEAQVKQMVESSPDIGSLKDHLHSEILTMAKLNIKKSLEAGNVGTSKWYLERKKPDEFSTKAAVAFEGAVVGLSLDEKKKEMDEFMSQFMSNSTSGSEVKSDE